MPRAEAMTRVGVPRGKVSPGRDGLLADGRPHWRRCCAYPYYQLLEGHVADVRIPEMHTNTLRPDDIAVWHPEERAT